MSRWIDAEWLKAFFEADKGKSRNTPIDSLLALIDDAPSIDIEPKRGEWKNHKDEHYCANCGGVVIGDWYDEDDWYDFCPNCGAEMRGADDE